MINDQNFLMYKIRFSGNFCRVFSNLSCIRLFKIVVVYLEIFIVYLARPYFYFYYFEIKLDTTQKNVFAGYITKIYLLSWKTPHRSKLEENQDCNSPIM